MARPRRRRNLTGDDLGKYGSVAAGNVDVDRAAAGLKVPKSQVRDAVKQARDTHRQVYFRAISGRREADVTDQSNAKGMLLAAFGRGVRGAAVNAKAAADKLGVAVSTVRRWAAGKQRPSPDHLDALQSESKKAATTKAGRTAATDDFRSSPHGRTALTHGGSLRISGNQGPGGNVSDAYTRDRSVTFTVGVDDVQAMLRAYEEDGDKGLHAWLTEVADKNYLGDWGFITIEDFGFGPAR
ncbi:helix-turn-helix domain-containing protein [Mycobacterium servetii]|uniref:Helix-turn-helix domain-containing protein n=1 Tax=Mycobacterium servetii TaxID=3237418 RepID=A0ABV4CB98_9MYCO